MAPILNPDNYLNFLTPADAFQYEVARNLYLAVLGATIWDILVYIPDDIRILRMQNGIRAINVCFVTSRLFALCYVLLSALAKTIPLNSCGPMFIAIGCFCILSIFSSSFLFLRRVQAVWAGNRLVKGIFLVLWVLDGGLELTVPLGVRAVHIPGTKYCIDSQPEHYVIAGGIIPVIFDTSVFLAISYKIASSYSPLDVKVSWNTLVSGKALPRLSRAILQGGQQYYLITTGVYIILVILLGLPSIPPVYRNMFAFPSVSLTASMACRVYRNIILLDLGEESMRLPVSDINFVRDHPTVREGAAPAPSNPTSITTQPTGFRGHAGGNTISSASGTLGVSFSAPTKSHGSWSEPPAELKMSDPTHTANDGSK